MCHCRKSLLTDFHQRSIILSVSGRKGRLMSVELPRFKKALSAFAKQLPTGTFWRYSNGYLPPPFGPLLLEHPELAIALAEDAVELAQKRGGKGDDTTKGGEA